MFDFSQFSCIKNVFDCVVITNFRCEEIYRGKGEKNVITIYQLDFDI